MMVIFAGKGAFGAVFLGHPELFRVQPVDRILRFAIFHVGPPRILFGSLYGVDRAVRKGHAAQSMRFASAWSRASISMRWPAGRTSRTAPMPWPDPQIWLHALALAALSPKFIALASALPRLSGSSPAARIEGAR